MQSDGKCTVTIVAEELIKPEISIIMNKYIVGFNTGILA